MYFIATTNNIDNGFNVYSIHPDYIPSLDNQTFTFTNPLYMGFQMQFTGRPNHSYRFYLFHVREQNNDAQNRFNYLDRIRNYIQYNIYDENINMLISVNVTNADEVIENDQYRIEFTNEPDNMRFVSFRLIINNNHPNYNILLNP